MVWSSATEAQSLVLCSGQTKSFSVGGGQLGRKHAQMCVLKSEGNGSFFGIKGMKGVRRFFFFFSLFFLIVFIVYLQISLIFQI